MFVVVSNLPQIQGLLNDSYSLFINNYLNEVSHHLIVLMCCYGNKVVP